MASCVGWETEAETVGEKWLRNRQWAGFPTVAERLVTNSPPQPIAGFSERKRRMT